MDLNEMKIRKLVLAYEQEPEEQEALLKQFQKEVELYVYSFPKMVYRRSQEECADFYLYVLERLHTIIKNFPLDSPVKFKTWFNYVLKNQYVNFYRKNKKTGEPLTVDIAPMESEIAFEQEFSENQDTEILHKVICSIPEEERILIKLYYMPERIESIDIQWLSRHFGITIENLLVLRNNLISIHEEDSKRIREVNGQLLRVNQKLVELKYQMKAETNIEKQNVLLLRIARGENHKFKLIRKLSVSEKRLFAEFVILFKNVRRAKEHLNFAKRRFKAALIRQMTKQKLRVIPKMELF